MKRNIWVMATLLLAGAVCSAQSLGDVARQTRSEKKDTSKKVYDNDNMPTSVTFNDEKSSDAVPAAEASAKDGEKEPSKDQDKEAKEKEAKEKEKAQKLADVKKDIVDQQKKIADIQHEIELTQREMRLRGAVYYSDAGERLRDGAKWTAEQKDFEQKIKDKQTELADAQTKLQELNDRASKEGATSDNNGK